MAPMVSLLRWKMSMARTRCSAAASSRSRSARSPTMRSSAWTVEIIWRLDAAVEAQAIGFGDVGRRADEVLRRRSELQGGLGLALVHQVRGPSGAAARHRW